MVQTTFKWKCVFFSSVVLLNVFANTIPTADNIRHGAVPKLIEENEKLTFVEAVNATRDGSRIQNVRPGQTVRSYEVEITVNGNSFNGRANIDVRLTSATRADEIVLRVKDLTIKSVKVGVMTPSNAVEATFYVKTELLYITPPTAALTHVVIIEYSGQLSNDGHGLHLGQYNDNTYLAMNLYPTYATRVFPCVDELTVMPEISFKFNNLTYSSLVSNSVLEGNSPNQFHPVVGPPHLWGLLAHNFVNSNRLFNFNLFGRQDIADQDYITITLTIKFYYDSLNIWTNKAYTEMAQNQGRRLNIFGLPDVSTDWNSFSIIGIWEPYLFLASNGAIKAQSIALPKIAEAIAQQWFGYMIYPKNRRYEWVVSGMASYAGWDVMRNDQNVGGTRIDVNTLFVTDVIQEALLRDAYSSSKALEPKNDLYKDDDIRDHIGVNGILKYKAPALMRMTRTVLGDAKTDYIQLAAKTLLRSESLLSVDTFDLIDSINSKWFGSSNHAIVGDFGKFLKPWIHTNGYPLLHVLRINNNAVLIVQESFSFSTVHENNIYKVPITCTTSKERNFSDDNIYPDTMLDSAVQLLNVPISGDDWILFNIQGQGYYRVTYDDHLWEKIIEALENPETRKQIHPLNRATLVDDALNVARAGRLDYDIALKLVLTMEHETEYAPWKAFVRNMDFVRKRLAAYTRVEENLDTDIYLKIIKKAIKAFEDQIGFYPIVTYEPEMQKLTRSLVMDHVCRVNYQPCIVAAKNWFYDPNNKEVVNPNVPHDMRPAVYCTMVRDGDENVIKALKARLEMESTLYERLVILESLACSQDETFINGLLMQTIAPDGPYSIEERVKIFAAVAGSSYANANLARDFLRLRTLEIRQRYGAEKFEEVIFILSDNMADEDQRSKFLTWVNDITDNNIQDSQLAADRALNQVNENLVWGASFNQYVYSWIAEHTS